MRLRLDSFKVSQQHRFGFENYWDVIANAMGAQWRYREVAHDLCSYATYVEPLRISRAVRSFLVISLAWQDGRKSVRPEIGEINFGAQSTLYR